MTMSMGNIISNDKSETKLSLTLSNGGTSVFISVLALAGSQIAKTDAEVELITWIASHDQSILGRGTVSFDLQELPWSSSEAIFVQQKNFLLSVIRRVRTKEDLTCLEYDPPFVAEYMTTFEHMLHDFHFEYKTSSDDVSWPLKPEKLGERCFKHGVFKHVQGCVVCHDEEP